MCLTTTDSQGDWQVEVVTVHDRADLVRLSDAMPLSADHVEMLRRELPWETDFDEQREVLKLFSKLRDSIDQWVTSCNLAEDWVLESVLENFCGWSTFGERDFPYPGGHIFNTERGGGSISGPGLDFAYDVDLPAPPVYDPAAKTWQEYLEELAATYRPQQEEAFARAGFHKTRVKRARTASPALHYEWIVRYQVQNWTIRRVAAHYLSDPDQRSTVRSALRELAVIVGLTLRRHPAGRPSESHGPQ